MRNRRLDTIARRITPGSLAMKLHTPADVHPETLRVPLLRWFSRHRRDLPWRRTTDPYAIWVSEVMLQQTQVATVVPYYERFLAELPTVEALAGAPPAQVLRLWSGLGYYSRARNLYRAAQVVMQKHGGRLPSEVRALRALPGIGEYTTGAILSIAFGVRAAAVDGNVERVLCRVREIGGDPKRGSARREVRELAATLVDCARPGDVNQALMELGATLCTPSRPACARCPLRETCLAMQHGTVAAYPRPRARARQTPVHTAAAIVRHADRVLLAQRPGKGLWGGLWEFPQVEILESEDPCEALAGHLRGLGVQAAAWQPRRRIRHAVMNRVVTLQVIECMRQSGRARRGPYAQVRWVTAKELEELPLSAPHAAIAESIRGGEPGAARARAPQRGRRHFCDALTPAAGR